MPQSPDSFDIAIIGGRLSGLSAAVATGADSEARVVLIDKDIGHNNLTPFTFSGPRAVVMPGPFTPTRGVPTCCGTRCKPVWST